ncbi:MAG: hypothetical protein ABR889_08565, partial [Acidobacteriaceae bacterium]
STTYSLPRYLLIVFAFAGDSTITSDFAIRPLQFKFRLPRGNPRLFHRSISEPNTNPQKDANPPPSPKTPAPVENLHPYTPPPQIRLTMSSVKDAPKSQVVILNRIQNCHSERSKKRVVILSAAKNPRISLLPLSVLAVILSASFEREGPRRSSSRQYRLDLSPNNAVVVCSQSALHPQKHRT